jgi:hypothetical protein
MDKRESERAERRALPVGLVRGPPDPRHTVTLAYGMVYYWDLNADRRSSLAYLEAVRKQKQPVLHQHRRRGSFGRPRVRWPNEPVAA